MPTYRIQDLTHQGHELPAPPIVPVSGLQPFKRAPAYDCLRAQDKVATTGRRIVCDGGVRGDVEWRVPDSNPENASQIYPNATTWYVIGRGMIEVTPGCFYEMVGACVPSGETNRAATAGEIAAGGLAFQPAGPRGDIRVTIVWTDRTGATETTTHQTSLPPSQLQYGAQNTNAGGLWSSLRNFKIPEINPPDCPLNAEELTRFCQHVTAEITVEERGSPRLVDWCIYEVPVAYAYAPPDNTYCTQHVAANGTPDSPLTDHYAWASRDTVIDPTGTERVLAVAQAQARRLGPVLFKWHGYDHTNATATSTEFNRTTNNDGTTFEDLLSSSITSFDPTTEAAFSVACGGYGRRWAHNNPLILFDRTAVIPVLVRVRGATVTAGTGTVRVQTATHSYVDVNIPIAGANAWVEAYGWLEVGINPDDPTFAQVRINHNGASGSLNVNAVEVYFMDGAAPSVT